MTVTPIPEGYHTVTPWIISRDTAKLIDFLTAAFDAEELGRFVMPDGGIGHAEVRIGDSVVMMFDAKPDWPPTPGFLRFYVPDADAVHAQAVAAGAESVTEVTLMPFGDRVGRVRDSQGNLYWIQTHVEDVTEEQMHRRFADPAWQEAVDYVQGAEFFPATT